MKCVCGYEIKDGIDKLQEPFIVSDNDLNGVLILGNKTYKVYACPKCGTLKIDL
jgi:hypothetical protein